MAEPLSDADRELLADVQALLVADNEDCCPMRNLGPGGEADVSKAIWRFHELRWVYQPLDANGWRLTQRGTDVLQGRRQA